MFSIESLRTFLYPHGARFDSVPGGEPEFTVEEANAVWGVLMTRDRAACVVVESLYAEPMILTQEAHAILKRTQLRECWRRLRAVEIGKLAMHLAEEEADGTHGGIQGVRRAAAQARAELETARAAKWPNYSPRYKAIRQLAAEELMRNIPCRACGGRKTVKAGELVVTCTECGGRGRLRASDRSRAEALKMSHVTFRKDWGGVFEFTLNSIDDFRSRARREMRKIFSEVVVA